MKSNESATVSAEQHGLRLDKWLASRPSIRSRKRAREALDTGKVAVDGVPCGMADAGQALHSGQEVVIAWARPRNETPRAKANQRLEAAKVSVIYCDADLVVVDKPAGLLTDTATRKQHRSRDSLRKQLHAYLNQPVFPAHRIDRDTTGVVAFARSEKIFEALRAQWRDTPPERAYIALVEGEVKGQQGTWSHWMAWDAKIKLQQASHEGAPHARYAQCDWQVLARNPQATALELKLRTGRRNQLRLQAMLEGHPLLGETQYRRGPAPKQMKRQALHARRLVLKHPKTGASCTFEAPIPRSMRALFPGLS